jgi:heme exporter protein A
MITFTDNARLSVCDLTCSRNDTELFSGLSFELQAGGLLQIAGANGSGKTTLLRCLSGLFMPDHGDVLWNGSPINKVRSEYAAALRFVGHKTGIKHDLTPVENLALEAELTGNNNGRAPRAVLQRLGVQRTEALPCRALSMGQQRRVALARLLLSSAQLWILDEPLASLDSAGQELVNELLQEHAQAGGMTVFSSHHGLESGATRFTSIVLGDE